MSFNWGCTECIKGSNGMNDEYHYCPYCGWRLIDKQKLSENDELKKKVKTPTIN